MRRRRMKREGVPSEMAKRSGCRNASPLSVTRALSFRQCIKSIERIKYGSLFALRVDDRYRVMLKLEIARERRRREIASMSGVAALPSWWY